MPPTPTGAAARPRQQRRLLLVFRYGGERFPDGGKLGNSSVIYDLAVFRGNEPEPAALGRFVHVYVDAQTRKPVPVPAVIRAALAAL